jgi:cytochrome P450
MTRRAVASATLSHRLRRVMGLPQAHPPDAGGAPVSGRVKQTRNTTLNLNTSERLCLLLAIHLTKKICKKTNKKLSLPCKQQHKNMTQPRLKRAHRSKILLKLRSFYRNQIPNLMENIDTYGQTHYFSVRYNQPNLITVDPEVIQHVLRRNADNYEKEAATLNILTGLIGNGLLTSTGEYHDKQRKTIQPAFRINAIAQFTDRLHDELSRWTSELGNKEIEVGHEMRSLTFRLMLKAICGNDFNDPTISRIFTHFCSLQNYFVNLVRFPRLKKYYDLVGKTRKATVDAQVILNTFKDLVAKRKQKNENNQDLLDFYLQCKYDDSQQNMSDEQVIEELLTLIVAGHETATDILIWLVYTIGKHEQTAVEIKAELAPFAGRQLTFQELQSLEVVNKVIDETFRLYPPSWTTSRVAKADDEINGIAIPKNTRVTIFIYGLHHNPNHWPDPDNFDLTRFTPENKKNRHMYAYMPFGAGTRMCVGRNFALLMMQTVLVHLYNTKKVTLLTPFVGIKTAVTLQPDRDVMIQVMD